MHENLRVSIITPTFNRANFLVETIDSILNQNYPYLEYIVLDDGSTDTTESVVKKYKKRITYIKQKNEGETKTVNKGLKIAKGDIIGIVNSDDPLLPRAIEKIVAFFKLNPTIDIVYPDWILIDERSKRVKNIQVEEYSYMKMVDEHFCLMGPGTFFRKSVIKKLKGRDESFKYVADFEFWLRAGQYFRMKRLPEYIATFRTHKNSQSVQKNDVMAREHIRLVETVYQYIDLPTVVSNSKGSAYASAYMHAAQTFQNRRLRILSLMKAFHADPAMSLKKGYYECVKVKQNIFRNYVH